VVLRRQQAFFDHFLLGRPTEVSDWPPVRYQVRDRGQEGTWKAAADWPVPGTSHRPLYLDAGTASLSWTRPAAAATVSYDSERAGRGPVPARGRATWPLAPGEIVPLEIEILPSGTRFGPGEALRLVIQGRDVYRYPRPLIQALHDDSVNRGPHVIHAGGEYDSHLLVPMA
jgi:predicted acyl esterase